MRVKMGIPSVIGGQGAEVGSRKSEVRGRWLESAFGLYVGFGFSRSLHIRLKADATSFSREPL